jgi:Rrf2 family protein
MVLYLAQAAQTVPSSKLSAALGTSSRYLLQIGARLRDEGIVRVSYGNSGGYVLAKSPDEITLFDIIVIMEGNVQIGVQSVQRETKVKFDLLDAAYEHVNQVLTTFLETTTISQLLSISVSLVFLKSYNHTIKG